MAPRKKFYLVFTEDPPAVDIVRSDCIVSLEVSKCEFNWEEEEDKIVVLKGEVLAEGLRKDLALKLTSKERTFLPATDKDRAVGTRKQEISREKHRQKNALGDQLQEQAEVMVGEGSDALLKQLQPVLKAKKPSLPQKREAALMTELCDKVENLPCFKGGMNMQQLLANKNIYCDIGKLTLAKAVAANGPLSRYPKKLFQGILKSCLPQSILNLDGISMAGKRGCVGIPPELVETIYLYVCGQYKSLGGKIEEIKFNPFHILGDLVRNTRRLSKKVTTASSTSVTITASSSQSDPISFPSTSENSNITTSLPIFHPTPPSFCSSDQHSLASLSSCTQPSLDSQAPSLPSTSTLFAQAQVSTDSEMPVVQYGRPHALSAMTTAMAVLSAPYSDHENREM